MPFDTSQIHYQLDRLGPGTADVLISILDALQNGDLVPPVSATPASIGNLVTERTNDTTITFKLMGSDGVVRSATLTLT
jgi:hypothetical protein